jgi:hypothetical protein
VQQDKRDRQHPLHRASNTPPPCSPQTAAVITLVKITRPARSALTKKGRKRGPFSA